jgi:hypothetical protein
MRQMSKLLITVACGLLALPAVSVADDYGRAPPPRAYRNDGRHPVPLPQYGGQPGHYNGGYGYYGYGGNHGYYVYPSYGYSYYGHNHHHENDDALWAIGGLVVGAIIGNAVAHASAPPPATTSAPAPVPAQNCYDDIIHDPSGNPHVERHCYPATTR